MFGVSRVDTADKVALSRKIQEDNTYRTRLEKKGVLSSLQSRLNLLLKDLQKLNKEKDALKLNPDFEQDLQDKLNLTVSYETFDELISRMNEKNREIGELQESISKIEEVDKVIRQNRELLENIDKGLFDEGNPCYQFRTEAPNSYGSGKKQGEIICFDLAGWGTQIFIPGHILPSITGKHHLAGQSVEEQQPLRDLLGYNKRRGMTILIPHISFEDYLFKFRKFKITVFRGLQRRNLNNNIPCMTPTYILPSGEDVAENGWNSSFTCET